jgi:hypothetical protein
MGRKPVSFGLVLAVLMLCPFPDAKERRGARIKITNKDGGRLEGELIAVKPDSLLLLSRDGQDVTADIAGIDTVQIVKESKFGTGLLIGAAAGAATGAIATLVDHPEPGFQRKFGPLAAVPICGGLGLAAGGVTGLLLSQPETVKIGGANEAEIAAAMEKLRKQARVRDFR